MAKMYRCEWGNWDEHAMNSYDPKTSEEPEDFFTEDNGYEQEEIEAIEALQVGERYDVTYGNHTVTRIK